MGASGSTEDGKVLEGLSEEVTRDSSGGKRELGKRWQEEAQAKGQPPREASLLAPELEGFGWQGIEQVTVG